MSDSPIKPGKSSKDSMYLARIKAAIALKRGHPRHHGVKMQAHHVISAEGMRISGLGEKVEEFGYDINELSNLVFIPCTLQGACYLGVQPHRGNHTARISDQDSYDDDSEPPNYHEMIAERIESLDLAFAIDCSKDAHEAQRKIKKKLDTLSEQVTEKIQLNPRKAPLTEIAMHFAPGNQVGCGGTDSVTRHKGAHHCAVERNHLGRQGRGQQAENITYVRKAPYVLKVGE
jgi:hypothetical protein